MYWSTQSVHVRCPESGVERCLLLRSNELFIWQDQSQEQICPLYRGCPQSPLIEVLLYSKPLFISSYQLFLNFNGRIWPERPSHLVLLHYDMAVIIIRW